MSPLYHHIISKRNLLTKSNGPVAQGFAVVSPAGFVSNQWTQFPTVLTNLWHVWFLLNSRSHNGVMCIDELLQFMPSMPSMEYLRIYIYPPYDPRSKPEMSSNLMQFHKFGSHGPNRNRCFTELKNGWIFPWLYRLCSSPGRVVISQLDDAEDP